MARRRWHTFFTANSYRTVERVAIATLAAIATRGTTESVAYAAITIFVIVVIVEEFSRGWIWVAKKEALRALALKTAGDRAFRRSGNRADRKRCDRRTSLGPGKRAVPPGKAHNLAK
jgi:hypothetical protein